MASRGVNKVILLGNLGQDPEVRYSPGGTTFATVNLATNESWLDKQTGQQQQRTEWHRVLFFNRMAEVVGEYLRKGSQIYVEGRLQTRKWQDQQGQDRWTTEVVALEMQMLGGRQDSGTASYAPPPAPPPSMPQVPAGGGPGNYYAPPTPPSAQQYGGSPMPPPQQYGGAPVPPPMATAYDRPYTPPAPPPGATMPPPAPPATGGSNPATPPPPPSSGGGGFDDDIPF